MASTQRLYSLCKMASLGQTLKLPKTYTKQLCDHITVVLCKKSLEKTPNIWKMRRFWKLEKWPLSKGHSLCKMVSLRQKIKLLKTCEKRLHKHITAVFFKKRSKKHLIFEKWDDFENRQKWPLCKGFAKAFAKALPLQNGQFASKHKIATNMRKTTLQAHYICFMQKTARKNS